MPDPRAPIEPMSRYLDLDQWPRRAAFEFFRRYDDPFFNICTTLEVGPLTELAHAEPDVSFFLAYTYLSLRAANEVEPFRYRLEGDRVLVHDRIHAGSVVPVDGDAFTFAYFEYQEEFGRFQAGARQVMEAVRARRELDPQDERSDLIHYSTLPWVSFTSVSHARRWGRGDSVPKIVFGRYAPSGGRLLIPISVEVHHALMDGVHVGRYLERLQAYLSDPRPVLLPG